MAAAKEADYDTVFGLLSSSALFAVVSLNMWRIKIMLMKDISFSNHQVLLRLQRLFRLTCTFCFATQNSKQWLLLWSFRLL